MRHTILSIGSVAIVLAVGLFGFVAFSLMAEDPAAATPPEQVLRVQVARLEPMDHQVELRELGWVRPRDVVSIAPEVAGRVERVHPDLEVGEIVPKGEVLFEIDARVYEARLQESEAAIGQTERNIERLRAQLAVDRERLETLERSAELAEAEYLRLKRLLEDDQVGTQSGVDAAERAYNQAADAVDALQQALTVYPIQIREMESKLQQAGAGLRLAEIDLERTVVRAPFDARIKRAEIEAGAYVTPGMTVLTLANDALLEIPLPLDSRDAKRWLRFDGANGGKRGSAWFQRLEPVACEIRWVEDKEGSVWRGRLARVQEVDNMKSTITVVVEVDGEDAQAEGSGLPLVEGMFCQVDIPGRVVEDVYRLPQWAVTFDDRVYLADEDGRLAVAPVERVHSRGDYAYVRGALRPGAPVVVTRLVEPLQGMRLKIDETTVEEAVS